jgi:hypothetical protein
VRQTAACCKQRILLSAPYSKKFTFLFIFSFIFSPSISYLGLGSFISKQNKFFLLPFSFVHLYTFFHFHHVLLSLLEGLSYSYRVLIPFLITDDLHPCRSLLGVLLRISPLCCTLLYCVKCCNACLFTGVHLPTVQIYLLVLRSVWEASCSAQRRWLRSGAALVPDSDKFRPC